MKKLDYEAFGRDLVFKTKCTCPSDLFKDSPIAHLMQHTIKLWGYDDHNFFHNVNKEPRHGVCKCGRTFTYQWFEDGVDFAFDSQERSECLPNKETP